MSKKSFAKFLNNTVVRRINRLGQYILVGGSLISCAGTSKKSPFSENDGRQKKQKRIMTAKERAELRVQLLGLFAKAEYKRFTGHELVAKSIERDAKELQEYLNETEENFRNWNEVVDNKGPK